MEVGILCRSGLSSDGTVQEIDRQNSLSNDKVLKQAVFRNEVHSSAILILNTSPSGSVVKRQAASHETDFYSPQNSRVTFETAIYSGVSWTRCQCESSENSNISQWTNTQNSLHPQFFSPLSPKSIPLCVCVCFFFGKLAESSDKIHVSRLPPISHPAPLLTPPPKFIHTHLPISDQNYHFCLAHSLICFFTALHNQKHLFLSLPFRKGNNLFIFRTLTPPFTNSHTNVFIQVCTKKKTRKTPNGPPPPAPLTKRKLMENF